MANAPLLVPPGWLVSCCCCALIIAKLEDIRMKAMANVSPISKAGETENMEDDFFIPRAWNRYQNKIRLYANCSIKIIA